MNKAYWEDRCEVDGPEIDRAWAEACEQAARDRAERQRLLHAMLGLNKQGERIEPRSVS